MYTRSEKSLRELLGPTLALHLHPQTLEHVCIPRPWDITQMESAVEKCYRALANNKRHRLSYGKSYHEFVFLAGGSGIGKTTLLKALPALLTQKVKQHKETFRNPDDPYHRSHYRYLSLKEVEELETGLSDGYAVYIDFNHPSSTYTDESHASYALGRRIAAQAFEDFDPSLIERIHGQRVQFEFRVDSVLSTLASLLHEKAGNKYPKAIILLLDIPIAWDKMYVKTFTRAIGGYMFDSCGQNGSAKDNVWLLPVIRETSATSSLWSPMWYGSIYIRLITFDVSSIETILSSSVTKERLPFIDTWMKNADFRRLALSCCKFGRAIEIFVEGLMKLQPQLPSAELSHQCILLIENAMQEEFDERYDANMLIQAYGGETTAKLLVMGALAGVRFKGYSRLPNGISYGDLRDGGFLWQDKKERLVFPLPTLRSLIAELAIPILLPALSDPCAWSSFTRMLIDFEWVRASTVSWLGSSELFTDEYFEGALLGRGCVEAIDNWRYNYRFYLNSPASPDTYDMVQRHTLPHSTDATDVVIPFLLAHQTQSLPVCFHATSQHSDIQEWYNRAIATPLPEDPEERERNAKREYADYAEKIRPWYCCITNDNSNMPQETKNALLQSCPYLVLVTSTELPEFIPPYLQEFFTLEFLAANKKMMILF